jgi:hypothetical protein
MQRQLPSDFSINRKNLRKAESVIDALFVAAADQVEVGKSMAYDFEVSGRKLFNRQLDSVDKFTHRNVLTVQFVIISALLAAKRLRARAAQFSQIEQKLELLFDLQFTLNFVYFEEKTAALGFEQVMRINRAVSNPGVRDEIAETKLVGYSSAISFV